MKKYLVIIFCLIINQNLCFSQERVNKQLPKISPKVNSQLTKATGWAINESGQWVSNSNKISKNKDKTDKTSFDNFISFEFRNITIRDTAYILLIKKYKNTTNDLELEYFIINPKELEKFADITDNSINLIEINVLQHSNIFRYKETSYLSDIAEEINKDEKNKKNTILFFHIAPYKNKNIVQFLFYYVSDGKKNIIGFAETIEYKIYEHIYKYFFTDDLFKKLYYETDYKTFDKFIKLP